MGRLALPADDRGRTLVTPRCGQIWWAENEEQERPVLVITRDEAIPVLGWIIVAPVTRTVRRIPSEIALGPDQGLDTECAASVDNLYPERRARLTRLIGTATVPTQEICRALAALADC